MPGCCVDQGVSKVQTEVETIVGSLEAEGLVYSYDCCLAKNCNSFQCFLFALCPLDSLVGLVHNNYWSEYLLGSCWIDDAVVLRSLGAFSEAFYPAITVNAYQKRSRSSRRCLVSRPLIIPLVDRSGRTGTYVSTPLFKMATILSPGFIPASERNFSGITTWYFFETLTFSIDNLVVIRHDYRYKAFGVHVRPAVASVCQDKDGNSPLNPPLAITLDCLPDYVRELDSSSVYSSNSSNIFWTCSLERRLLGPTSPCSVNSPLRESINLLSSKLSMNRWRLLFGFFGEPLFMWLRTTFQSVFDYSNQLFYWEGPRSRQLNFAVRLNK